MARVLTLVTLGFAMASCESSTPIATTPPDASPDSTGAMDTASSIDAVGRDAPADDKTTVDAPGADSPADMIVGGDAHDARTDNAANDNDAHDASTDNAPNEGGRDGATDLGDTHPFGSCTAAPNPDTVAVDGGVAACSLNASAASPLPCTTDCCVPCGIDLSGVKTCTCTLPGLPYNNCICLPPINFPTGLTGAACSPQGYSGAVPAGAPAGSISLEGVPCTLINNVCFTADSSPSNERGCICLRDGTMHCGPVNHWFTNNGGVATPYN